MSIANAEPRTVFTVPVATKAQKKRGLRRLRERGIFPAMMTSFSLPDRFAFEITEDGSPTLRFRGEGQDNSQKPGQNLSEAMHSLRGAFSETLYIYGTAIERTLDEGFKPDFLSLGLGLGYNEVLIAALIEARAPTTTNETVESFEADADLVLWFEAWIRDEALPTEMKSAYDRILELTSMKTGIAAARIAARLARQLEEGRLRLRGALEPQTTLLGRHSCFLFDAFSSKTSPALWSEDFLTDFLARAAWPQAVFSTYACTGTLKRTLRAAGFELMIREGFSSKRDSTFAVRK